MPSVASSGARPLQPAGSADIVTVTEAGFRPLPFQVSLDKFKRNNMMRIDVCEATTLVKWEDHPIAHEFIDMCLSPEL